MGSIGIDVRIAIGAVFKRGYNIGHHVAIDHGFYCTPSIVIGDYVHIGPYVSVIGGESLFIVNDFCTISAGTRINCASDEFLGEGLVSVIIPEKYRDTVKSELVMMREFSNLATNVVVNPGVTIGQGAVVGANSYVSHDIPPWEIWVGSPARFLRKRPHERMLHYAKELGYDFILDG